MSPHLTTEDFRQKGDIAYTNFQTNNNEGNNNNNNDANENNTVCPSCIL